MQIPCEFVVIGVRCFSVVLEQSASSLPGKRLDDILRLIESHAGRLQSFPARDGGVLLDGIAQRVVGHKCHVR